MHPSSPVHFCFGRDYSSESFNQNERQECYGLPFRHLLEKNLFPLSANNALKEQ